MDAVELARPLLEWTRTWSDLERALGSFWSPPQGGEGDSGRRAGEPR